MIALFLLAAAAAAPACHPIEGDSILGRDLARADARFAAIPPDVKVGYAPAPGAHRAITISELEQLGERFGVFGEFHPLCFEYPMRALERTEIAEALALALPQTEVQLVEFSLYRAPLGGIVFPPGAIGRSSSRSGDPVLWRGYVSYAGGRRFSIWAKVVLPPDAVARGGQVQVEVESGLARLKFEGRAETAGAVGDVVTVRNLQSGKTFPARVVGRNKVLVETGASE